MKKTMQYKTMRMMTMVVCAIAAMTMAGCSSSYLDQEPAGGIIRQDQFEKLNNTLEGSMRGIYAQLYAYGGQDAFGERAIDMYGDILSGDMAVTTRLYGWFYCDENMETNTDRTDYLWGYYYGMMHNLNSIIDLVAKYPTDMLHLDPSREYTEAEATVGGYYAEALTMRGYVLMRLLHFYCPLPEQNSRPESLTIPIYTRENQDGNVEPATLKEAYEDLETSLETAITYFEKFGPQHVRPNKLTVDINIARTILAYAYINKVNTNAVGDEQLYNTPYRKALALLEKVMEDGAYRILPNDNVLTTGFNNINEQSWMWGQEVTSETATLLGSFFGQVDIHTYSYAWAGETKVIDKNLYNAIPAWDKRKLWFNDGKANKVYSLCPDGKFFSARNKLSTKSEDVDRDYTSDNVFLRIEAVYLMASEAAYRLGEMDKSRAYLTAITDERVLDDPESEAAYATWKASLSNGGLLREAIGYNWRVELWGEGFGLQTLRRFTKEMQRGDNHLRMPGATIKATDPELRLIIPSNEYVYKFKE